MTKDEALKLALEALEDGESGHAAQIIREALAQPEQGPVAWMFTSHWKGYERFFTRYQSELTTYKADKVWPLYTTPPQRQSQPAQEPITWMCNAFDGEACEQSNHDECENPIPLYITPQKREWVGITDEHIGIVLNDPNIAEVHQGVWLVLPYAYAYAIEAKSKELNK